MSSVDEQKSVTEPLVDDKQVEEKAPSLPEYTEEEVAKHNTLEDCWLIIGEPGEKKVYDVTKFLDDHPGGPEIIMDVAGQNATADFDDIGHSNDAKKQLEDYLIGRVKGDIAVAKKSSTASASGAAKADTGNSGLFIALSVVIAIVALFLQFRPVE